MIAKSARRVELVATGKKKSRMRNGLGAYRFALAALIASAFCFACTRPVAASAASPPIDIPGASTAIAADMPRTFDEARRLTFVPGEAFRFPGTASAFRPLTVWVRFTLPQGSTNAAPMYLEAAPAVGRATLFYAPAPNAPYASIDFGMRVPFAAREIPRVHPTIRIPAVDPAAPLYLRLSVDDESVVVPLVALQNQAAITREDAAYAKLATAATFFIGVFVSLAAANMFVFLYMREASYLWYSGLMLSNALFAATYMHGSSWRWLWPHASLPDAPVQVSIIVLLALFLLGFARTFVETHRLVPKTDRLLTGVCLSLAALGVGIALAVPSAHVAPLITGRAIFVFCALAFVIVVFALGVAALRSGSIQARFFVVSNAAVSMTAAVMAISNFSHHDLSGSTEFVALLTGQSVEGWLLFGALAFRLRQVAKALVAEQQRRIVAQAEALAQAHALLEHRQLASTDALTKIGNRRAFDDALSREWDRSARACTPITVLLVDVDHFKAFNDTYGHVLGDDCLRRVAAAIAKCATRPTDVCARYGGEEFALILPETDAVGGRAIAEEIVRAVRHAAVPHRASSAGCVTVSVGFACVVPEPESASAITELADAQLYRAKEAGRNRVASEGYLDATSPRADRISPPEMPIFH